MADFKAKNLTYDKSQPAFLQRLRAEYSGERNNVQFARPNKSRLKMGDADEDEPTIVDEAGKDVPKEEWEEMLRREEGGGLEKGKEAMSEEKVPVREEPEVKEKQTVAKVGGPKKRKVGKVVGDDDDRREPTSTNGAKVKRDSAGTTETTSMEPSKPKKKAKKIKLSFDEEGD